MKFNVEVDCTPEEARHFLGLPDLRPMQEAVLAKLQDQMLEAVGTSTSPDALLKLWMPMLPQSPEQVQQAMTGLFRMFMPGQAPAGGGSGPAGGKPGKG
jgi:Family of unknown function (DUF6489)